GHAAVGVDQGKGDGGIAALIGSGRDDQSAIGAAAAESEVADERWIGRAGGQAQTGSGGFQISDRQGNGRGGRVFAGGLVRNRRDGGQVVDRVDGEREKSGGVGLAVDHR